jgi:hypothetical protein
LIVYCTKIKSKTIFQFLVKRCIEPSYTHIGLLITLNNRIPRWCIFILDHILNKIEEVALLVVRTAAQGVSMGCCRWWITKSRKRHLERNFVKVKNCDVLCNNNFDWINYDSDFCFCDSSRIDHQMKCYYIITMTSLIQTRVEKKKVWSYIRT